MPSTDVHKQFQKWAEEYGPVYSLIIGTSTMIVLTSDVAVKDLLDKRSAIYSDRLDMYIGYTLCSGGLRFLMMPYGPTWRIFRKISHSLLSITASRSYTPYQILESEQMLYEMLQEPENFLHILRRFAGSLTTSLVYG
jgi:cytochrome P450